MVMTRVAQCVMHKRYLYAINGTVHDAKQDALNKGICGVVRDKVRVDLVDPRVL